MTRLPRLLVVIVCVVAWILEPAQAQSIIHVKAGATGAADGTSWVNAFPSLQDGLAAASAGDQIWVAQGSYRPDDGVGFQSGDRGATFVLKSGVRLHGGFSGSESTSAGREILRRPTILTGDLNADDSGFDRRDDNSYHVIATESGSGTVLLDGFVVQGGHANGSLRDSLGGGMLIDGGSVVVMNTLFIGNYGRCGGGIAHLGGSAQFVNLIVSGNRAKRGGGICSVDSSAEILSSTIVSNLADAGAGLYNLRSSPSVVNSVVARNSSSSAAAECVLLQFPCSIAEVPDEINSATLDILRQAQSIRAGGTMQSASEFLRSHPDVVHFVSDDDAARFRIAGGVPAWITDVDVVGSASKNAIEKPSGNWPSHPPEVEFSVVGEDGNNDGRVDNRDVKRALLLSPYEWQFGTWDDAGLVRDQLASISAYEGNVVFKANPDSATSTIQLSDYESWSEYDLIFVSTHGKRVCGETEYTQMSRCEVVISSGVVWTDGDLITAPGVHYVAATTATATTEIGEPDVVRLALTRDFFRSVYGAGLDNSLVIFSACETGGQFASALANDLGSEDFVMLGWSESVPVPDALSASGFLMEELAKGITVSDGLRRLDEAGLRAVLNSRLETAELTRYAPGGGDQRIMELPTILDDGEVIRDGASIQHMVQGVVGDADPDRLRIDLLVRGVFPETRQNYAISYAIDGQPAGPFYDLGSAVEVSEYAYLVQHTVDLGLPLLDGPLDLEVVVALPEGGESRFSVDAYVEGFDCSFNATMVGAHGALFNGPAGYIPEDSLQLVFESVNYVTLDDPSKDVYRAVIWTSPPPVLEPGTTLNVSRGDVVAVADGNGDAWSSYYWAGFADCPTCGGTVTIDSLGVNETLYGSASFTGIDIDERTSILTVDGFKAVPIRGPNSENPFQECRIQY